MARNYMRIIAVSLLTREKNADGRFDEMQHRILFGRSRTMPQSAELSRAGNSEWHARNCRCSCTILPLALRASMLRF